MEQRATFDRVAGLYGSARPGYCDALIEDVCKFAELHAGDRVLEVGCGAGQATVSLAGRGYRLTAVDPGAALIEVAQAKLAHDNQVDFVIAPFEAWDARGQTFKLLFSAQAWHWIPPDISFAKAADCLTEHGVLAVFGHVPSALPELLNTAFEAVYVKHLGAWGPPPERGYLPSGPFKSWFDSSGRFETVIHRCYRWIWRHTAESYVAFARTRSDHQMLPEGKLDVLLSDLHRMIDAQGGAFDWPYETHLYMAKRRLS
jgi:SAM-dependent methyltransferase